MSETFWKGEPVETMHRDVLVEILRQQHFRIEALEAALREIGTLWGAGTWAKKIARAALAGEATGEEIRALNEEIERARSAAFEPEQK